MSGSADHIVGGVTHHDDVFHISGLLQQVGDHIDFMDAAAVKGRTTDHLEITGKIKMCQHFVCQNFWLGSGNEQTVTVRLQLFQHLTNTGVGEVLKFSHSVVAAAEYLDGFLCTFLRDSKTDKGLIQRRAYEHPHLLTGGNGNAEVVQRQRGTVDDALTGVGKRAVKIKEYRFFRHTYHSWEDYNIGTKKRQILGMKIEDSIVRCSRQCSAVFHIIG